MRLRGNLDRTPFLTLGDAIEIVLGREHVEALREQTATTLGDMTRAEAAEALVHDTFDAGVRARAAGRRALAGVEVARRAGADEQADRAHRAGTPRSRRRNGPRGPHEPRARRSTALTKPPRKPHGRPMRRTSPEERGTGVHLKIKASAGIPRAASDRTVAAIATADASQGSSARGPLFLFCRHGLTILFPRSTELR
ncbi:hypothetical protein [Saccharothrix luteola]|uniref:hypothetical protein n=1 Tax=Saccharothrix luteola TaxID=2893018 RepID=UPI001E29BC5C|nr:hypothetical protein [Saccharothrix luteola]MCC8245357.1 hypothetical protein [Saccharothrix luteola]